MEQVQKVGRPRSGDCYSGGLGGDLGLWQSICQRSYLCLVHGHSKQLSCLDTIDLSCQVANKRISHPCPGAQVDTYIIAKIEVYT